ncbi:hypothetical protein [Natrononativus amylolyticus]|uniref:hypothetical protein n=1 Tax=Natrononativus amylolyticus TaxID=2963434 RepID=UPI0020CD0750|nr:hypothetical protein [Natrononativus amylolyticus]
MSDGEEVRVTFRADRKRIEYLDWLIDQRNAKLPPGSDEKVVRSDLLRERVDELIEDLEEELDEKT